MLNVLQPRHKVPHSGAGYPMFIYGTLRSGEANHHILEGMIERKHAVLLDDNVRVRQQCVVDIGGLPALYNASIGFFPNIETVGEVYLVTPIARDLLDLFEGSPHMYRRAQVVAAWDEGGNKEARMAFTYFGPVPGVEIAQRGLPLGHLIGDVRERGNMVSDWSMRNGGALFRTEVYDLGGVVAPEPRREDPERPEPLRWAVINPFPDEPAVFGDEEEEEPHEDEE